MKYHYPIITASTMHVLYATSYQNHLGFTIILAVTHRSYTPHHHPMFTVRESNFPLTAPLLFHMLSIKSCTLR